MEAKRGSNGIYKPGGLFLPRHSETLCRTARAANFICYGIQGLQFICTGNVVLKHTYNSNTNTYEVEVFGGDDNTSQAIYAIVPSGTGDDNYSSIGKLSLAHYA